MQQTERNIIMGALSLLARQGCPKIDAGTDLAGIGQFSGSVKGDLVSLACEGGDNYVCNKCPVKNGASLKTS